jgi:small nuclear ribonucleoprotein (snRNP)-like protein
MKISTFYFLMVNFFVSCAYAQEAKVITLKVVNNTEVKLVVYKTEYYADSTKAYGLTRYPIGGSSRQYSKLYHIRIDYIVVDDEAKDTIALITASKEDLKGGLITLNKGVNNLKLPFKIQPRLEIKAVNYRNILKTGDPIEIKLNSNKKVSGTIMNYDRNKILILNEDNQKTEITPKDIRGIKSCSYLHEYVSFEVLKNCKYNKTKSVKFEVVEQIFDKKKEFWDWVKIE